MYSQIQIQVQMKIQDLSVAAYSRQLSALRVDRLGLDWKRVVLEGVPKAASMIHRHTSEPCKLAQSERALP
jgi:hypothetical protein